MIDGIKKGLKKYLGLIIVILIAIILYRAIESVDLKKSMEWVIVLMKPFIYGLVIAYILNPVISFFKDNLFSRLKLFYGREKAAMGVSMLLTYFLLFAIIYFMTVSILPQILSSAQGIINYLFTLLPKLRGGLSSALTEFETNNSSAGNLYEGINQTITTASDTLLNNLSNVVSTLIESTYNVASWLFNMIIGLVISVYMILNKDNLINMVKKTAYLVMSPGTYNMFGGFMNETNRTFESFFIGKAIDSLIIAFIFFCGCCFINRDYALLFACVIGITNMIPYFGPFIGGVPVVALCLLQEPYSAIWMAIFIFALQQFDGYILGPKVLGSSIGIKPLGVIFAILVGGGIFGVMGMFFGVPVFAVISKTLDGYIDSRLEKKRRALEQGENREKESAEYEQS